MTALFGWWLLLGVLGLAALPLTAGIFSARMHYGYGFAKIAAVLVFSYVAWILAEITDGSFRTCLIVSGVVCLSASAAAAWKQSDTLRAWLRNGGARSLLIH